MTREEVIRMVGDVETELDVLRGSFAPGLPIRVRLDDIRDQLDDLQLEFVKVAFDEGTPAYAAATTQLDAVNKDILATIGDVNKAIAMLKSLTDFVSALDQLVLLATKFVK